jgi:hypothetical protein
VRGALPSLERHDLIMRHLFELCLNYPSWGEMTPQHTREKGGVVLQYKWEAIDAANQPSGGFSLDHCELVGYAVKAGEAGQPFEFHAAGVYPCSCGRAEHSWPIETSGKMGDTPFGPGSKVAVPCLEPMHARSDARSEAARRFGDATGLRPSASGTSFEPTDKPSERKGEWSVPAIEPARLFDADRESIMWQFYLEEGADGRAGKSWHNYVPDSKEGINPVPTVESMWQMDKAWGGKSGVEDVKSGEWLYRLDFSGAKGDGAELAGTQKNTHKDSLGNTRPIRRVTADKMCTCGPCRAAIATVCSVAEGAPVVKEKEADEAKEEEQVVVVQEEEEEEEEGQVGKNVAPHRRVFFDIEHDDGFGGPRLDVSKRGNPLPCQPLGQQALWLPAADIEEVGPASRFKLRISTEQDWSTGFSLPSEWSRESVTPENIASTTRKAAVLLQARARGRLARQRHLHWKGAAVLLQAWARGSCARVRVLRMAEEDYGRKRAAATALAREAELVAQAAAEAASTAETAKRLVERLRRKGVGG